MFVTDFVRQCPLVAQRVIVIFSALLTAMDVRSLCVPSRSTSFSAIGSSGAAPPSPVSTHVAVSGTHPLSELLWSTVSRINALPSTFLSSGAVANDLAYAGAALLRCGRNHNTVGIVITLLCVLLLFSFLLIFIVHCHRVVIRTCSDKALELSSSHWRLLHGLLLAGMVRAQGRHSVWQSLIHALHEADYVTSKTLPHLRHLLIRYLHRLSLYLPT